MKEIHAIYYEKILLWTKLELIRLADSVDDYNESNNNIMRMQWYNWYGGG